MVAIIMYEDGERLADVHELWPGEYAEPDPEPELDFRPYIYGAEWAGKPGRKEQDMVRKIDVYINGKYQYSSINYRTCKEAIADIKSRRSVNVASIPPYMVRLMPGDKVTARIDHNYN